MKILLGIFGEIKKKFAGNFEKMQTIFNKFERNLYGDIFAKFEIDFGKIVRNLILKKLKE